MRAPPSPQTGRIRMLQRGRGTGPREALVGPPRRKGQPIEGQPRTPAMPAAPLAGAGSLRGPCLAGAGCWTQPGGGAQAQLRPRRSDRSLPGGQPGGAQRRRRSDRSSRWARTRAREHVRRVPSHTDLGARIGPPGSSSPSVPARPCGGLGTAIGGTLHRRHPCRAGRWWSGLWGRPGVPGDQGQKEAQGTPGAELASGASGC